MLQTIEQPRFAVIGFEGVIPLGRCQAWFDGRTRPAFQRTVRLQFVGHFVDLALCLFVPVLLLMTRD